MVHVSCAKGKVVTQSNVLVELPRSSEMEALSARAVLQDAE